VIDDNDDPLVSAVDDNADRRKAVVDLLRSDGIEAGAFDSAAGAAQSAVALPRTALLARLGFVPSRYGSPWAYLVFLASIAGLAASLWPEAMPGVVSIWQAAFTNRTHIIVGSSISVILPLLLLYTGFGYRISCGKGALRQSLPAK
jgi:cytochrome bd-type quinol oxidase subunit 2